MKIIGFHNPEEEYGFLSNWFLSDFRLDNISFTSMEQFMMYRKALCFHDQAIAKQILATDDVARIKELGRLVSGYDDRIWGIGLSMTDPKRLEPAQWKGQNLLGYALMMARERIRKTST